MILKPILWIIRAVREAVAEERHLWKVQLGLYQSRGYQVSKTKEEIFYDALYFAFIIVVSLPLLIVPLIFQTQLLAQPLVVKIMVYSLDGFVALLDVLCFYIFTIQFVAHYQTMNRLLKNGTP